MKAVALLIAIFLFAPVVTGCAATAKSAPAEADEPRPFDEARDAMADIDAALAAAKARGTRVLLVLGGNWCHDSRGLASKFEDPTLAALIAARYELVWIDVGRRDKNLDVAKRFGVGDLLGTPTILILSGDGALLNASSAHDWRDAASRSLEETYEYFQDFSR
jgi:hypothetical protein